MKGNAMTQHTNLSAMKQALEVMTDNGQLHPDDYKEKKNDAIAALRLAIEQAERQEPVAWKLMPKNATDAMLKAMDECSTEGYDERLYAGHASSVYTAAWDALDAAPPPNAQRQPLTEEEIWREYQALWPFHPQEEPRLAADMATFARAIERAHGIGGRE
jgi:hypothetical protein